MADRDPIDWITVHGQHIPIYEGESRQEVYSRAVAKHNEDTKQKQIAKNKEQADKLNAQKNLQNKPKNTQNKNGKGNAQKTNAQNNQNTTQNGKLPKQLPLKNVSAKDANSSSDVLNLRTKQRFKFKDGTEVRNVYVFAGKGCAKEFRDAEKYAKRYSKLNIGKASEWQHCAGKAVITDGKRDYIREVHWVQGNDGKIREAFIKEYASSHLKDEKGGKKK